MSVSPEAGVQATFWGIALEQFRNLPLPEGDCAGQIIIVTGSNTGMGREAARHFVRLKAAKVILACRNVADAENAKQDIEASTRTTNTVEVWHLDLSSFDSVKRFSARVAELDRLDTLVNNAALLTYTHALLEGHESMVTVNVISTFLLTLMVLPTMRKSATRHNITPRVTFVASDAAYLSTLPQRKETGIFELLKGNSNMDDQYNTTKLIEVMAQKHLANAVDSSGKGHILINSLNPGFTATGLFRNTHFVIRLIIRGPMRPFARRPEMASRTLVHAALASDETHGRFLSSCAIRRNPSTMLGTDGAALSSRVYEELLSLLEEIEPGVTNNI